jgi:hypothetical protein
MIQLLLVSFASASDYYDLGDDRDLAEGTVAWTAGTLVNLRAGPEADAPVRMRLGAASRVTVIEQVGVRVEVQVGKTRGWIARELLTTMGMRTDLDGDGVAERVVVALDGEGRSVAWLRDGDRVSRITLYPWPDPYLGEWKVVPAAEAGVALLRVDLSEDACGAYPSTWLSYQGGELRRALHVLPWGDGGYGETFDVSFAAPGHAVVHAEEHGEDGEVVAVHEQSCALDGGVFACS